MTRSVGGSTVRTSAFAWRDASSRPTRRRSCDEERVDRGAVDVLIEADDLAVRDLEDVGDRRAHALARRLARDDVVSLHDDHAAASALVTQMYFDDTDAKVLAQDKLLQHDMWGKTNPLPSAIFAKLQKDRSTLDPKASHYQFDIVL